MLQNYAEKARQTRKHYLFLHFLTIRTGYVKTLNHQLNITLQKLRGVKRGVKKEVNGNTVTTHLFEPRRGYILITPGRKRSAVYPGYHSHNTPVSTSKRLHINNPGSQTQCSVPGVSQSQHTVNPERVPYLRCLTRMVFC